MDEERALSSHNLDFLEALHEAWSKDPSSVDPSWRRLLEDGAAGPVHGNGRAQAGRGPTPAEIEQIMLQAGVDRLIAYYRLHGHLEADLDPLGRGLPGHRGPRPLSDFGLEQHHLSRPFNAGTLFDADAVPLEEIVARLRRTYCRRIGVEYWHLPDIERREWLRERMERCENQIEPPAAEQARLLRSLARVDRVDKFLHSRFLGAKRFSIAGGESVISLLETLIEDAGSHGVVELVIGMAHRGRLSVLMNVLGKTPLDIFAEFESGDPWASLGSGDVKYHKGSFRYHTTAGGHLMYLALAFNPSHLEAITPVISGRVRAKQDYLRDDDHAIVLGVTIHGDGAIAGQGVFAETLNLSRLPGYATGGTIRVVINNQVGFTTNPDEARSTLYSTAVADMLTVPIFHVNGDDPEAAAYVAQLAVAYRQKFRTDVILDLVCYRRFGHNEGDEPTFTQPRMYELVARHPSVHELYERRLLGRGTVSEDDVRKLDAELDEEFEKALAQVREAGAKKGPAPMHGVWEDYLGGPEARADEVVTATTAEQAELVRLAVTTVPEGFNLHPKLRRLVGENDEMLRGEAPLSWAVAEYLAYGTLVMAGHDVRISGQDAARGTFNHRHAVWVDTATEARHTPLQHVRDGQARFEVYNSPLSEFAVVGFEFGYTLAAPHALVIWEAQFGDFANGAQVIIDQFVSSSEDKWNRVSGLVFFLPHGYEGQGPEHSSARLERFLQLAAEDNMQVCNLSTTAQMFHVLRRQVLRRWRKPLVIMTPKSLLRYKPSFSPRDEFLSGGFHRVLDDPRGIGAGVRRLLLCSGKVYYDLEGARAERGIEDVAIGRIEQLYPFPEAELRALLERYPEVERLDWVQEEPENMGGWTFVAPRLEALTGGRLRPSYHGRVASASPATGSPESHKLELSLLLQDVFGDPKPKAETKEG